MYKVPDSLLRFVWFAFLYEYQLIKKLNYVDSKDSVYLEIYQLHISRRSTKQLLNVIHKLIPYNAASIKLSTKYKRNFA